MWESAHGWGGDGKTASAGGMAWLGGVIHPRLVPVTCPYCCTAHFKWDWSSFCAVAVGRGLVLPQHLPLRWSTSQLSQRFMGTSFILQLGRARSTYPVGYPSSPAWHFLSQAEGSGGRAAASPVPGCNSSSRVGTRARSKDAVYDRAARSPSSRDPCSRRAGGEKMERQISSCSRGSCVSVENSAQFF